MYEGKIWIVWSSSSCILVASMNNMFYVFSNGVGRTGVFLALSIILDRMRYEGVVDVFQTVKLLRIQRPSMVKTEVRSFGRVMIKMPACTLLDSI